jgi:hypothetical protein
MILKNFGIFCVVNFEKLRKFLTCFVLRRPELLDFGACWQFWNLKLLLAVSFESIEPSPANNLNKKSSKKCNCYFLQPSHRKNVECQIQLIIALLYALLLHYCGDFVWLRNYSKLPVSFGLC